MVAKGRVGSEEASGRGSRRAWVEPNEDSSSLAPQDSNATADQCTALGQNMRLFLVVGIGVRRIGKGRWPRE